MAINNKLLVVSTLLVLSIITNIALIIKINKSPAASIQPVSTNQNYRLVSPLKTPLIDDNETQDPTIVLHFNDAKPLVEAEIAKAGAQENVGIFLQDINTGAWLGINEREGFLPASMLKVPIMIAILKQIDRNEIEFESIIEIEGADIDPYAGTLYQKGPGAKLTVWELIKEMILSSDNTAKNALKRQLTSAELNAVFTHVGIPNPYIEAEQTVTPRGYTRVLKSLYYSSFLSPLDMPLVNKFGKKTVTTYHYHRPLQDYMQAFTKNNLSVFAFEEVADTLLKDKKAQEFPLFLAIGIKKVI